MLTTERLVLVSPEVIKASVLLEYHQQNMTHFAQAGGTLPESLRICRQRLKAETTLWKNDRSYRFYGLLDGDLILDVSLSNLVRGVFQGAHLGYKVASQHTGQGLMTEAVDAVVTHAFTRLRLHRVMANYQPWNLASGRILDKLGFEREGFAKDYLFINGQWRDHILTSKTNTAFRFKQ
ncbi:GNAT family N-acetyltransferase [Saccharospirillum impatiens]|uniref:GNAT family N-acetyltransferase n=1 Tax=Saccharospirillum impatiens TaxID=169438 RepID=UPI000419A448|nr:GNAT family N-acetyltransferase [Saccharospirillum impatiens]